MDEREKDEKYVEHEEEAAAAEAARIGGRVDYDGVDPAQRPVVEGGEGESEGFELAERELEEHASHGDPGPDPTHMAGEPEVESDRSTEVDGEADEYRSTEREGYDE